MIFYMTFRYKDNLIIRLWQSFRIKTQHSSSGEINLRFVDSYKVLWIPTKLWISKFIQTNIRILLKQISDS